MKKQTLIIAAAVSLALAGSALADWNSGWSYKDYRGEFDANMDADILALRGAPGTADLVADVECDANMDADILALRGAPGTATLVRYVEFDPIMDAAILALAR